MDLEQLAPGPQLAAVLAAVDRSRLSGGDLTRVAVARNRLAAHVQAELIADLYAVGQEDDTVERAFDSDGL